MNIALLGSGEFQPWARPVDEWLAESATASSDRALVVPTASAPEGDDVFDRWGRMGVEHYRALGLTPQVVPLRTRADASDPAVVDALADARLVFFSGGNPGYLAETLAGTPFWDALVDAVGRGTGLGGCSAGASAIGTLAPWVDGGGPKRWVDGLRLLPRAYVLPHYDALEGYMPGLTKMLLEMRPDGTIAIGLDEGTALYGDGRRWSVAGAGSAWFADDGAEPAPCRAGDTRVLHLR